MPATSRQGPQTMGQGDGQSATIGDLSENSSSDWSSGTATTSGNSEDEESGDAE